MSKIFISKNSIEAKRDKIRSSNKKQATKLKKNTFIIVVPDQRIKQFIDYLENLWTDN